MKEKIEKIKEGFDFKPEINGEQPEGFSRVIVGGMGGSHLSADFINAFFGNFMTHKNYGLPNLPPSELQESFFIAVSHSGNTEETQDFAETAYKEGYKLAIVSGGGKLLDFAKANSIPYIITPTEIPARMSVGFQMNAILALMNEERLNSSSSPYDENMADEVVDFIGDYIPIIYSSEKNFSLANYLKVLLNESSKIPAFINNFPELNHNEMNGFHRSGKIKDFRFLILRDKADYPKIQKRMEVFTNLFKELGAKIYSIDLSGSSLQEVLNFTLLANHISLKIAESRGINPEETLLIEKFKKLIL
jgi:glucose/mannose-6-phosphate isomerase